MRVRPPRIALMRIGEGWKLRCGSLFSATLHFTEYEAMKMLATAGVLALVCVIVVVRAVGADSPNRPPGVSLSEWAPVSDTLGIVLVQQAPAAGDSTFADPSVAADSRVKPLQYPPQTGAILSPPTNGYFMVKRGSRWVRLVVVEPLKGPGDAG
jgi:hypothetical protein